MNSPWVQRNLDSAQYPQARGSQYEGPKQEDTMFAEQGYDHAEDVETEAERKNRIDFESWEAENYPELPEDE